MDLDNLPELSDDEFLELMANPPAATSPEKETEEEQEEGSAVQQEEEEQEEESNDEESTEQLPTKPDDVDSSVSTGSTEQTSTTQEETESSEENTTQLEKDKETDYKSFYEKVTSPLKANGKTIQLRSAEEAIQLMQMGANYTRKMQDIAPHRKVLLMLENNGLLDETKLSYLIDLDKRNPEAIKRLVKESGLDPLDIDTDKEPAYTVGNHHGVSDQEANFRTVLDELVSNPTGQETVRVINQWDQASKNKLWEEPGAMVAINQQRENGIYDLISNEIERQKALGTIAINTPFLDAYTAVGDSMQKAGAFNHLVQAPQPAAPIATKVAAPKTRIDNNDKAKAAAPSNSTSKKAAPLINPLAMSDDEFLKQMANRV